MEVIFLGGFFWPLNSRLFGKEFAELFDGKGRHCLPLLLAVSVLIVVK